VSTSEVANGKLAAEKTLQSKTLPARMTLISHAPTLATKSAAFPLDEPLFEGENEKIAAIGWNAPRAQHVLCGPEKRTRQTAEALGLNSLAVEELSDINYGKWIGKELDEVQAIDPVGLAAWLSDPGASPHEGESLMQLIARVERWMHGQTVAGHTLAVTHPAVIKAAIVTAMQAPATSFWRAEVFPLSATDLRYNGRVWTVRSSGCSLLRTVE
jgi:broad specificity phosphatase PhoE